MARQREQMKSRSASLKRSKLQRRRHQEQLAMSQRPATCAQPHSHGTCRCVAAPAAPAKPARRLLQTAVSIAWRATTSPNTYQHQALCIGVARELTFWLRVLSQAVMKLNLTSTSTSSPSQWACRAVRLRDWYNQLAANRDSYLQRARDCAILSWPIQRHTARQAISRRRIPRQNFPEQQTARRCSANARSSAGDHDLALRVAGAGAGQDRA